MKDFVSGYGKFVAIILGVAMLSLFTIGTDIIKPAQHMKVNALDNEDAKTASEISNVTGENVDEILKMREGGLTWNEILERLKNTGKTVDTKGTDNRSQLILQSGVDKEYIKTLKEKGFKEQDIMESKLLVERVIFQLKEITGENFPGNDYSDITLLEKFDVQAAVYFMIRLKAEFGSIYEVLDEYLYSLQADMDFNLYLVDKEEYEKQKKEKSLELSILDVITISKIEEKMLEKLQKENGENLLVDESAGTSDKNVLNEEIKSPLPDLPDTEVLNVNPVNPTEKIINEIDALNPMINMVD